MARVPNIEKLSFAELVELRAEIDLLMVQKQSDARAELRAELAALAKQQGFELEEVVGGTGRGRRGTKVAVKYRDPNNAENTWTGRGRMPTWMAEATRKRGVTREDFAV